MPKDIRDRLAAQGIPTAPIGDDLAISSYDAHRIADVLERNAMRYHSPHGIEQSRRDFMSDYPDLYAYIAHREASKMLDSAGDRISGQSHEAANQVWAMAATESQAYQKMQKDGTTS